jgi:hypothetical protein
LDFHIAFERCEHDDASIRKLRADCDHHVYAIHVGQSQVHERDIRLALLKLLNGFTPRGGGVTVFAIPSVCCCGCEWLTVPDNFATSVESSTLD